MYDMIAGGARRRAGDEACRIISTVSFRLKRMNNICSTLHILLSQLPRLDASSDMRQLPLNGIYVFFEKGETAHRTDRIVRIGTHAGKDQMVLKLKLHVVNEHKDKSVFRKNIGRAILNGVNDPFLAQWNVDLTTSAAKQRHAGSIDTGKLHVVAMRVTDYIHRNISFAAIRVDEKAQRLLWESKIISTVSQCSECRPSNNWLGLHSPNEKIRESGLWLVNELYQEPLSESEYEALTALVVPNA